MVTTIQVSAEMKDKLSELKEGRTYEDVLEDLLRMKKRLQVAEDMKEYGIKYGKEEAKEVEEWHHTSPKW